MKRRLSLFATVILLSLPATSRANLIINGDFESEPAPSGGYLQKFGGDTLGGQNGWKVLGVDVLVLDQTYVENQQSPPQIFAPHGGTSAADLTGAGNTSPDDGLMQSITTEVGQRYILSFYVGRASSDPNYQTPSTVDLSIDGGPRQQFTNPDATPGMINWRPFVVEFIATGVSTSIAFLNGTSGGGQNNYAGLDDVEVVASPEPSTLISGFLAATAMSVVGWSRRRRSARPA